MSDGYYIGGFLSHPAWGAWIEISTASATIPAEGGRTPHGVRGLKYGGELMAEYDEESRTPHGVRGLKYLARKRRGRRAAGRTPHGVRGLKSEKRDERQLGAGGRTPHGVRGLKYGGELMAEYDEEVAPRMGCVD